MNKNHDEWFKEKANKSDSPKPKKTNNNQRFSIKNIFRKNKKNIDNKKSNNFKKSALIIRLSNSKFGKKIVSGGVKTISSIKKVSDKFNQKTLLKKILFTLLLLLIFRIAASITMPGIRVPSRFAAKESSFLGILDMMGGGSLRNFSIVALGISPYITASILMTLLQSEVFPPIYNLAKSGPAGKRKINIITRVITLILAILQAITLLQQFSSAQIGMIELLPKFDKSLYKFFVLPVILIAGSMFTLFLGEQITNKGVGNGTSLIIFSGIAAKLPNMFKNAWTNIVGTAASNSAFIGVMNYIMYVVAFLLLLLIITIIYKSERHVPIQQTGAGMTMDTKQMSRLPIKLNPGGVMPIIFSLMIISLPLQIVQFFDPQNEGRQWVQKNMTFTSPIGLSLMSVLIFFFSIGMGFVTFNPATIADNFKKSGTFIPGVRPGKETEDYLSAVVVRISVFAGFYLAIITSIKYIEQLIGLSSIISFGGTTIIILVSVAVETISQLTARDTTNKISRQRANSLEAASGTTGGLLW